MIRIGSLFSGYGGLDLAVQQVLGGEVAWHVEYDKAPSRILDHHFPGVPNYGDVTKLDFTSVEPVDVLTGGYPCQPFSHAGLRKGTNDDRHLWPHVLRAICEMGPRLAILENVRGHLSLGFDVVLADLADVGWSARWGVVRASDAGAPHQRARLFIVAYPNHSADDWQRPRQEPRRGGQVFAYPDGGRREQHHQGERLLQLPDQDGHHAADAAGDGRPQGRARSGEWTGSAGQPASNLSPTADASGERHGPGENTRGLGRLDSQDAGSARQRQRARQVIGDRGTAATADACNCQQQIDQGHDSVHGERTPLRRGAVVTAGARGNGVDSVGALAGSHAVRGSVASCDCGAAAYADLTGSQTWGTEPGRAGGQPTAGQGQPVGGHATVSWGDYGPAIARWERVIGRPAPPPTESGRTGAPRLSPAFVEWMMGLPAGWVTDPAIGISRNDQLKALGNGVVPQQAALALDVLLKGTPNDLRQTFATV